jgi:perosamine synthetase
MATAEAVSHCGATPVFVDANEDDYCINTELIKKAITKKTKAIIPVHLYGHPADMDEILKISLENNIDIIEDCAQAHFASIQGKKVGNFGNIGTFSFFPNKIITSGEGGLVISRNPKIYDFMKLLRGQGMSENNRYYFLTPGFNFRMTELQASILRAQFLELKSLWNARASSEKIYRDNLVEVVIESNASYLYKRSPWIFSARIPKITIESKLKMAHSLASEGIETRPVFYPLSQMPAFSQYANDDYPNSSKIALEGISLPTGLHVQPQIQKRIIDVIKEYAHHANS